MPLRQAYRLYPRGKGGTGFAGAFRGRQNTYIGRNASVIRAFPEPGLAANVLRDASTYTVYEYAVSAVKGHGEGGKCTVVDTDAASCRTWNPDAGLRFKRQAAYWLPPSVAASQVPRLHYPG